MVDSEHASSELLCVLCDPASATRFKYALVVDASGFYTGDCWDPWHHLVFQIAKLLQHGWCHKMYDVALTPIKPARSTDKTHPGRKSFGFPFNVQSARPSGLISLYSSDPWASG
jgi:hypothetical protein